MVTSKVIEQVIGELGAYMSGGIKIANSFRQEASAGIVQGSALK